MLLDALGLMVFGLFVAMGLLRGLLASALSLVALLGSYGAAILLAPTLGPPVASILGVSALVGGVVAGSGAFAVSFLCIAVLGAWLRRLEARDRDGSPRPSWDRVGGACFGAARGALVVVALAWLALWVDAFGSMQGQDRSLTEHSSLGRASERVVAAGVEAALGSEGEGSGVTARLLSRPRQTLTGLRSVLGDPRMERLTLDGAFWEQVQDGNVDDALERPSFRAVAEDAALRRELAALGLVGPAAAVSPREFQRAARSSLLEVGPRLRALRDDPDLARLASDPAVVRALERGEILTVLRHPRFQRVVSRAVSKPAS
jgi:membrane protein required for colicin V production